MCPIAGGNWNNAALAGVWALNLNNVRGNSNNNVGCRSDSILPQSRQRQSGVKGDGFLRVAKATAKSASHRLFSRATENQAAALL